MRVVGTTADLPVADVEQAAGHEIVHPSTTETWGVRQFVVRSPDGTVVDVAQHSG